MLNMIQVNERLWLEPDEPSFGGRCVNCGVPVCVGDIGSFKHKHVKGYFCDADCVSEYFGIMDMGDFYSCPDYTVLKFETLGEVLDFLGVEIN
jgi:hypothetical protein